ncbi:MAG: hypothetical protein IPM69_07275 [Ignavibacteria bacterium]|nr:hypothetical protein [Ignavibacteria bacterium]
MNIITSILYALTISLTLFFLQPKLVAKNNVPLNSTYTILYFINLDNCVRCDRNRIVSQLHTLEKIPNIRVIAVVHSFLQDDVFLYKKSLGIDSVIWDSAEIAQKHGIIEYPGIVVLNKLNDILYKFDGVNSVESAVDRLPKLLQVINYNTLSSVTLDKSLTGVLGQAESPYINFRDSTLWAVDGLRNSVMVYSLQTGNLLRSISPSEKFKRIFADSLPTDFLRELNKRGTPLSTFEFIAPLYESNGFVALTTLIESVVLDTILQVHGHDTTKRIKSSIFSRRVAAVHRGKDTIPEIYFPINNGFTTNFVKLRDSLFYVNTSSRGQFNMLQMASDTSLFYLSESPTLKQGRFFLSLSNLRKYYSIKKFTPSTGILEYNSSPKMFVFANPWNNLFCLSTPNEDITPISPIGAFRHTFDNFKPTTYTFGNTTTAEQLVCYMNDILSNSKGFYIVVQANNNQRVSDYCLIQQYNWQGKFIREIPILFADNKLSIINLIGCTEHQLYLLGKSSKYGWEIKTFELD